MMSCLLDRFRGTLTSRAARRALIVRLARLACLGHLDWIKLILDGRCFGGRAPILLQRLLRLLGISINRPRLGSGSRGLPLLAQGSCGKAAEPGETEAEAQQQGQLVRGRQDGHD